MQAMSAHPFTICSLPSTENDGKSELVFYVRHQRGFTKKLYEFAIERPGVEVGVMVDGPYGGVNMQKYYEGDTSLVIAGGSGAGWILPFVERFVQDQTSTSAPSCCDDGEKGLDIATSTDTKRNSVAERKNDGPLSLRVILATRDISSRIWFLRTVNEVLAKHSATISSSNINIQVFLTGDASKDIDTLPSSKAVAADTASSSDSTSSEKVDKIQIPTKSDGHDISVPKNEFEGRPQLVQIIHDETAKTGQSLGVFVCGPEAMQNDVRNAVAGENLGILKGVRNGGVYLHSEHFSWA